MLALVGIVVLVVGVGIVVIVGVGIVVIVVTVVVDIICNHAGGASACDLVHGTSSSLLLCMFAYLLVPLHVDFPAYVNLRVMSKMAGPENGLV